MPWPRCAMPRAKMPPCRTSWRATGIAGWTRCGPTPDAGVSTPTWLLQLAALPVAHDVEAARAARQAAEGWVLGRLDGNQRRQFEPLLARARRLCRAVDVAWDGLARVMAAAQLWLRAVAAEAVSAGLIADPAEVHFLELEELKQVATGEWHRGRSERVREEVVQRRASGLAAIWPRARMSQRDLPWRQAPARQAGRPSALNCRAILRFCPARSCSPVSRLPATRPIGCRRPR